VATAPPTADPLAPFSPAVRAWFEATFEAPTQAQAQQGTSAKTTVVPKQGAAIQMANTVMSWWNDSILTAPPRWSYDMGVVLKGMEALWKATGDATYFRYIQKSMDVYVQEDGTIKGYRPDEYNIDHINNGTDTYVFYIRFLSDYHWFRMIPFNMTNFTLDVANPNKLLGEIKFNGTIKAECTTQNIESDVLAQIG